MDKKISSHQLFSITTCVSIGGSVLIISSASTGIAKQDAWISAAVAAAFGFGVMWIYYFLGSRYPDMTLIGMLKSILGKWLGTICSICLLYTFLLTSAHLPWYVGNFVSTEVMPQTPLIAINLLFVAAILIACFYGLETIARASEIFTFVVWVSFFSAMFFVSPNAEVQNLQPILEGGVTPVIKSALFISCFITFPVISILMVYPVNFDKTSNAKKALFKGYLLSSTIIFATILLSVLVLGSAVTSKAQFPTYLLGKEINLGTIFTRIEFIYGAIWINTQFLIGAIYFYASMKGLSELLGLKSDNFIILPLGLIVLILSLITLPDSIYQSNWTKTTYVPNIITSGFILPVSLLIVFFVKKSFQKIKQAYLK